MKVIRNSIIPFGKWAGAINLFGVIFVKGNMRVTPQVLNHERIHTFQQRELLFIPFYIIYLIEWLIRLVQTKGNIFEAYMKISFEREAYAHDSDLDYLKHRPLFAQWR